MFDRGYGKKLRFPLLFGGMITISIIAFKNRHHYFRDELEEVRRKGLIERQQQIDALRKAKREIENQQS